MGILVLGTPSIVSDNSWPLFQLLRFWAIIVGGSTPKQR